MIRRTTSKFDLRVSDEMDRAEYAALVMAINELLPNGEVTGESIKSDVYQITIEKVEAF